MASDAQHKRWGELPPLITETESGIAAIEREQITKPRPVPIQGAALYQPGAHSLHFQSERSAQEYGVIDPITLHTIALIQHAKKVQSCITNLQQQDRDIKPLEAEYLPPIPEGPCIPGLTSPGNSSHLEMKSEKKSSWKPPPQLGDHATRVILRRAVTAICAQAGFDTTWNSVLEVLTDVCSDIYSRICWQLRTVVDREALTGQTGFMDAMDHALHESGLEGLQSLVQFFDERIVGYNRHMLKTCRKLHQTYHKVKLPQSCSSDDTKNIKVKEEPVSEIHFPSLEDGDENMAEAEEVPMDELHRALQNLEGVPLKDDDASKWLAQQQQQQQQQPLAHHRKGSTASSAGHLDADEEIVIVSDSPPLSAEVSIGSLVDSVESGSLDATRLGRPPPLKKKKKT